MGVRPFPLESHSSLQTNSVVVVIIPLATRVASDSAFCWSGDTPVVCLVIRFNTHLRERADTQSPFDFIGTLLLSVLQNNCQ